MPNIDVTELLSDPDFAEEFTLIRRSSSVGTDGRNTVADTPETVVGVIQPGVESEYLTFLPQGVRVSDWITVYYAGVLTAERAGGYSDVIKWKGVRYIVSKIPDDFSNYGTGFTVALACREGMKK